MTSSVFWIKGIVIEEYRIEAKSMTFWPVLGDLDVLIAENLDCSANVTSLEVLQLRRYH
jgi:hypothetical protein